EPDIRSRVCDGDVHFVARDKALPGRAAAQRRRWEPDSDNELAGCQHVPPRAGAEIDDWYGATATGPGDLGLPVEDHHCRYRIGGGRRVAEVTAKARSTLDRCTTDDGGRLHQSWIEPLDDLVPVYQIKRSRRADRQADGGVEAQLLRFANWLDVDEQVDVA